MGVFGFFFSISLPQDTFPVFGEFYLFLYSLFLVTRPCFFLFSLLMYASVLLNTGPEVSGEALFFKKESVRGECLFFTL